MSIKKISVALLLSSFLFVGCQQSGDNAESTSEENTENNEGSTATEEKQEQETAPAQGQPPMPGQQSLPSAADISDEELETFATAMKKVQAYGQEIQQEMLSAVEEEGLDPQRFGQIQQAQQMPDQSEVEVSDAEMQKFEKAQARVEELQAGAQEAMEQKIQETGMTVDRYREIMMVAQRDPELQKKINEI